MLIPYWSEKLGKTQMSARQVSLRGGDLRCELKGDRVLIGGQATLYMKGKIFLRLGTTFIINNWALVADARSAAR